MAEQSPLATIRELGGLGVARAKELPGEFATARQLIDQAMNKLQNPGWTVNAPLLAASLAMFKPTRAGGFGESLAHAGDAGIPALQAERQRELSMNAQLAALAKERGQLGVQEANALMSFPGQAAGLESALQDLRFYEMMTGNNMPGGARAGAAAQAPGVAGAAPEGAPVQTAQAPGGAPGGASTSAAPGASAPQGRPSPADPTWAQTLPPEMRGRVANLARVIEVGQASGSKAGLERAAQAQQLLQGITGPGWMYDSTRGGFVAVGERDPNYVRQIESIKNWAKVMPEAQLHEMKKRIDAGYEFIEITDANGQTRRITNEMAREALGYPRSGGTSAPAAPGRPSGPMVTGGAAPGGAGQTTGATPPPQAAASAPAGLPSGDAPVAAAQTAPVAEYGVGLRNAFTANQKIAPRLERMYDILRDLESGSFAEKKAEIVAGLRSLGLRVPDTATANPEAVQKLLKETITSVFEQIKGVTSRPALQEFIMLQQANANPELQPGANAAIIKQALGLLDYENAIYRDWVDWRRENPNTRDIDPFVLRYTERFKPGTFAEERAARLGNVRGEPLPPQERLVTGTQYVLPNGTRARWNGQAFEPIQR